MTPTPVLQSKSSITTWKTNRPRNWLFCWTELGAKHVGIVQSLIATCRLHDINPYDYLVDVLQRVGQHPASRVQELTPRMWKPLFSANPLRSDLHGLRSSYGRTGALSITADPHNITTQRNNAVV